MGRSDRQSWVVYGPLGDVRAATPVSRRRIRRDRRRTERRFGTAPFPLYGLPPSWPGGRFLGGAGWGTSGARREVVNTLSLVHGSLVEGEGPMLVVETALPDAPSGGGPLRILAEDAWSGRTHTVFEAIERVRARWSGHTPFDATPPSRTGDVIVVDGVPIQFDRLARPDEWVACARVGAYRVTLEARCFPVEGLELVRVTDLAPYILGSRRFDAGADGST